tara:strand:- start:417 stop:1058 length:642 start_codon:yes stop_codon:yes gene_type:complete
MNFTTVTKLTAVGVAAMSVSGCFGNGGGNSVPGGPPPPSGYDAAFQAVQGMAPTATRLSGSADYTGEIEILTGLNQGNADERLIGDLDMNVSFDGGSRPITATASGFEGEIDGQQVTVNGTLSTANNTSGLNTVVATDSNVPGVGTITTTGVFATLQGTLTENTGQISGDAILGLTGNVVGANGEGIIGAATVTVDTGSGPFIGGGGTFYANQ